MGADVHDTGDDETTPVAEVNVGAYRRRKVGVRVPVGHSLSEPPREGGVEHYQVPVTEPPLCHEKVPPLVDSFDPEGERQCGDCKSKWYP